MASMVWSRLKSQLAERLAPAVRDRVAIHRARYRWWEEEIGRIWLTVDGREIAEFQTVKGNLRLYALEEELEELGVVCTAEVYRAAGYEALHGGAPADHPQLAANAQARHLLRCAGDYGDAGAIDDLAGYLSLAVEDALCSPSPLVRALAVLDRRVGKRRLAGLAERRREHPLVAELLALRLSAEGISPCRRP